MLVQGAGGNSSVKLGGRLIVKASGLRLADAVRDDIFVDLDLAEAAAGRATASGRLRPSIETSLHALLPHPVVAHLHMVDLLAFAVRADGEAALAPLLAGLDWAWLPYRQPGTELADGVAALLADRCPDIVVLGNHGIVFGGEDCAGVDRLVEEVRRRLAVPPRHAPLDLTRITALARRSGMDMPRDIDTHRMALDPESLRVARSGSLYPDHVVFLGRGVATWPDTAAVTLVPGAGVLMAAGLTVQAHEMAACLSAVATRVAADAPLRTLSAAEEDALIDWEAEAYRRAIPRLETQA